ncbi:ras GEF [Neocallimastix lanati (nom. inval.)]|uniref:Ras GEF n=1 Tax=Neocallimastix californiae TaxID=1754190 RepID=A0A1Y2B095_9FUNG|nr:ras GEF [Neocallimastix sp. JGI-2020a]ORY28233.1 ras GEF [Neocallimastix californiae]|eukprot:ORY28233.1 ras GEF [Neocallimastix californiae]
MMMPSNEMGYDNLEGDDFNMNVGRVHRMSESSRRSGDSSTSARLPPQWGKRTTYDGQVYYFNKVTDETCWDIEEINPETGELMSQRSAVPQERPPSAGPNSNNDYRSTTARILESELTWNLLLQEITHSVQLLNQSAQLKRKDLYVQQSTTIVEIIRLMLYASGTVKHDIQHYPNYQILKQQNKNIMHTLNLLVFATKTASQVWPPPDAALKMQQAANDVLGAVRQFIMSAQDVDIKLDKSLIEIRPEETRDNQEESVQGSSELIAQLEQCSQEIYRSTQKLVSTLRQPEYQTSFLITQTRSIVTDVGRFLSVVDEVQYDNMNSEATREFKVNRIALCNNISGLVMAAQNAVTPIRPNNANEQVILGAGLVEKGVKDFMISVKYLLQEKEAVETERCQKMFNEYARRPSAVSEHINQQYYMDPQMKTRNRRAVSLSAINSSLNEIPENGEKSILSAQEDSRERSYSQRNFNNNMTSPGRNLEQQFADFNINGPPIEARYERKVSSSSKNKLKQLLGDEAPNETSASAPDLNTKPWYLNYDYGNKDIVFNMEGKVKGATFPALIERLTIHDSHDSSFTQTFLLTYRSFATSMEVIDALIRRFSIKPPPQLTNPQDLKVWNEKKAMPIRLRVCNVLKSWIETYSLDLQGNQDDAKALETVREFFTSQATGEHANLANTIIKALEKRDAGTGKKMLLNLSKEAPPPILPKNLNYLRFLDIDPLEIARQLTIMESKTYTQIQPIECLNKAWSERENSPAVNVKAMIEFSNKTTGWVATAILRENDLKRRCNVLKHFILVADKCYSLNNFNTVMSILAGFNSSPIHRLKRTWEQLSKKINDIFENLERVINPQKNYAQYRENLHSVNPPCVPFLGVYLTDLTFIEDGNTNNLKSNNKLINFSKQTKTAEVIREIQQYQNQPYNLNPVKEVCDFILKCLNETVDETTLYDMSLILEPREREDEAIARKLQESGFL